MISTINTERSGSTPECVSFSIEETSGQFPEMIMLLSETEYQSSLGMGATIMPEITDLKIIMQITSNTVRNTLNYSEDYIEALLRLLQNYRTYTADGSMFYVLATGVDRDVVYTDQAQSYKAVAVQFQIHRNDEN
jgi:hypothetical protein